MAAAGKQLVAFRNIMIFSQRAQKAHCSRADTVVAVAQRIFADPEKDVPVQAKILFLPLKAVAQKI